MNQTLESIAKAIFKQWFIDFQFPGSTGEMENELPKGWAKKSLDEIAEFLNGLALQNFPPKNDTEYLPVIKIREIRQGITASSDKASSNIPKIYIVNNGDVLFSWSGSLEIVIWSDDKGALNQHLFKVSSDNYPKWFFYQWIKVHLSNFRAIASDKATTMGHIQRRHLKEAVVIIPPNDKMELLNTIMNPVFEKILLNKLQIKSLEKIRDSLLPKLITGQIPVNQ
jgi:type I restriction enzyme S subunit